MAKYDIPLRAYLNDLTLAQLENIHMMSGKRLDDIKSKTKVPILVLNDGSLNIAYFHTKDEEKAVSALIGKVCRLEFKQGEWKREQWKLIPTKVFPFELKELGLEELPTEEVQ